MTGRLTVFTTHYIDNSYSKEKNVNKMKRFERETNVDHWSGLQTE